MSDHALRRVGKNTAALLVSDVAGRAVAAGYRIALAGYLGTVLFGEYSFALAVSLILGVVSDLGLGSLVTREVSRSRERALDVAAPALAARVLLTLLTGGLAVAAMGLTGRPREVLLLVAIFVLVQLATGPAEILAAAHRGRERMVRPATVLFVTRLGMAATGLAAIFAGAGVLTFAWIAAAWALPAALLLLPGLPGRFVLRSPRAALASALPIGLGAILWTIYFRMDVIFVSYFSGDAEAGLFAGPFQLVQAVLLLQGPLLAAAFPVFASRGIEDPVLAQTIRTVARILTVAGPILAAILVLGSRVILDLFFGPAYAGGRLALVLLALTIPASFLAAPRLALLVARDRERVYAAIMAAALAANLALDLLFIPRYGAAGAAAATLATEILVAALALHSRVDRVPGG